MTAPQIDFATLPTPPLTSGLFFCAVCTKPFAKEISRNRHVQYCRNKGKRQYSRDKACSACNRGKIKCDFGRPCSRCTKKGWQCTYNSNPRSGYGSSSSKPVERTNGSQLLAAQPANVSTVPLASPGLQDVSMNLGIGLDFGPYENDMGDNFHAGNHFEAGDTADTRLATNTIAKDLFTLAPSAFFDRNAECSWIQKLPDNYPLVLVNERGHGDAILQQINWDSTATSSGLSLSNEPNGDTAVSNPLQKISPIPRDRIILITSIIRAYPMMLLRRTTLPPFIHAVSHSDSETTTNHSFPEALETCISIACMFTSRSNEASRFIWRTIDTERERLVKEMHLFSKEETLAAIQAMVIYLIMRMVDTGAAKFHTDLDMYAMQKLSERIQQCCHGSFSNVDEGRSLSWKEWIFEETRRRTVLVCYLLSLVSSYTSLQDLKFLPLSGNKVLWEATNHNSWEEEYKNHSGNLKEPRLYTFGDLMEVQRIVAEGRITNNLDEWNVGLDGLGMLLNIATAPL